MDDTYSTFFDEDLGNWVIYDPDHIQLPGQYETKEEAEIVLSHLNR